MKYFLIKSGSSRIVVLLLVSLTLLFASLNQAVASVNLQNEQKVLLVEGTVLDFDAVDLKGKRRLPMQSFINQSKITSESFGFITMRTNWKDKIIQSTLSLGLGKMRMKSKKRKSKIKK